VPGDMGESKINMLLKEEKGPMDRGRPGGERKKAISRKKMPTNIIRTGNTSLIGKKEKKIIKTFETKEKPFN